MSHRKSVEKGRPEHQTGQTDNPPSLHLEKESLIALEVEQMGQAAGGFPKFFISEYRQLNQTESTACSSNYYVC